MKNQHSLSQLLMWTLSLLLFFVYLPFSTEIDQKVASSFLTLIPENSYHPGSSKPRDSIDRALDQYCIEQSAIVKSPELSRSQGSRNFWELAPLFSTSRCSYERTSLLTKRAIADPAKNPSNSKFKPPSWCLFIYTYGIIPGQVLFLVSFVIFIVSFFAKKLRTLRWHALYITLTLVIGSGFFGHALFKQFWSRPRPKQVDMYGGKYPYCPLLTPYKGPSDRFLRSLPSGHATMGFYFFSLYFVGRRLSRRSLVLGGLFATGILGSLLTWARLAQGGHFVSDIVVSFLIMWMTAYWLDRIIAHYSPGFARAEEPILAKAECVTEFVV